MAFSMANMAAAAAHSSANSKAIAGPDLQEIQIDQLGFAGLNRDAETQIRLLPEPWPSDALPPPTASLLAVASSKGILAAAGPSHLVLASTDQVRATLQQSGDKKQNKIRDFAPSVKIDKPHLSHVVFSSTDDVLVLSSQHNGGLEAFQLSSLLAGNTQPALSLSTNSVPLRALVPNPSLQKPSLMAVVTNNGDLLLAELEQGIFLQSQSSTTSLLSGVSCVSWSNKGKQLVAGLANGTAVQLKPDGSVVAEIPRLPTLPDGHFVSTICWLENDLFFFIYTPAATNDGIQPSEYYIITRQPQSQEYTFQKLPDVIAPYGMERIPSHHYLLRLRSFPPHLQDLLLLSATSGSDVGLITKADQPLSQQDPVVGHFTLSTIGEDSKRAQLPWSDANQSDTSPVGMALDLSSKDPVARPIPSDEEIQQTSGPCPNVLILNNEGILQSWWLIYDDSVRQKTVYSGFSTLADTGAPATPAVSAAPSPAPAAPATTATPAFGQSSTIGSTKPSWASTGFGSAAPAASPASSAAPAAPAFGQSGFGQSGFGQPGFGKPAFGKPSFGSPSPLTGAPNAPAFGKPSAFASSPTPAFGKPSFGTAAASATAASPFGSAAATSPFGATAPKASGFAAFSGKSGFAAASTSPSPFGSSSGPSVFSKPASDVNISSTGASSAFGKPSTFKLQSSFKAEPTQAEPTRDDDGKTSPTQPSAFSLGNGLSNLLDSPANPISPTQNKEETMGDDPSPIDTLPAPVPENTKPAEPAAKPVPKTLVTPPSTLGAPKASPAPPVSDLFGSSSKSQTGAAATVSTGFSFGQPPTTTTPLAPLSQLSLPQSTTPQQTPLTAQDINKGSTADLPIKKEVASEDEAVDLSRIPPAPLPPDTVSKPAYLAGDTSVSASSDSKPSPPAVVDDAPLPPDFVTTKKPPIPEAAQQALPGQDDDKLSEGDSFENSGEEVDEDISPTEDESTTEDEDLDVPSDDHPDLSPESSFKSKDSPTGGLFTSVSVNKSQKGPSRPLFGEVASTGPILPPPKPQESPRSPSPVRRLPPVAELLRSEAARGESVRSVSAPAGARAPLAPLSIIEKRRLEAAEASALTKAKVAEEMARQKAEQEARARQQAEAAAKEFEALQDDDEDELLRRELETPIQPSESLADFVTFQQQAQPASAKDATPTSKTGVPAQIERLFQDVNRMINTVGLNSRALAAFMQYQQDQDANESWPSALDSDTPLDVLNDEWLLGDIPTLQDGQHLLEANLNNCQIDNVAGKVQQCQNLLANDLLHLRTNINSIRKSLHLKQTAAATAPTSSSLSVEQASIQQDLRKASASVRAKLAEAEDALTILRTRLAQDGALSSHSASPKKPTVEAVMKTINKMTHMAEKKSADVDVLEAQLRKLKVGSKPLAQSSATAVSGRSSVYHTPESKSILTTKNGNSTGRSTGSALAASTATKNGASIVISAQDKAMWQAKAKRKQNTAAVLRAVLAERRKQAKASN